MQNKTILILGGTGFIGRSLFDYFSSKGSNVYAPTRQELNLLSRDRCREYLKQHQPDIVIFSVVNVASVEESLKTFHNVISLREFYGRMICFGSGAEYNPNSYTPLMDETKALNSYPESGYALAKFLIGREIDFGPCDNIINLRLFGVFGEYENYTRRFISNSICRVLSGLPLTINRDMKFDYIYISDLCQVVEKIILKDTLQSRSYNFCSGQPLKLSYIADKISRIMLYDGPIIIKQKGFNPEYSGNPNKLLQEIEPFSFSGTDESIKHMVSFFTNKFEHCSDYVITE